MILKANGQQIDFLAFDTSKFDSVFLALSGGTDSAMLLYLLCKYQPNWKMICHTGIDKPKDPWVGEYASEIVDFIQSKFPNVEIIHEQYKFDSLDPIVLEAATKEWESIDDKSVLPTAQGYSKAFASKHLKREIRKKYNIKLSMHGITANPPIDVQKELGFEKVAEPRRNKTYNEEIWRASGSMHYRPFVNIDKKFIAGLYEQFNLLDDLFPLTMSCIGFEKETNYFTEPCRKCYWCHEKKWAFGCYDGGLLE
jgi:hypothetical protein|tara:strand:- start:73 stop:831 length:759 start_codon:yes stop_codon:yes gene_type:complete